MTPRIRTVSQVLVLAIAAGCYAYQPARAPLPAYSVVRVRFYPPRTLTVARNSGDSLRVDAVTQLEGLVREVHGDTLDVEVRNLWRGAVASTIGRGSRVVVTTDQQPVEVRSWNAGGVFAVALITVVVLVIIVITSLPET